MARPLLELTLFMGKRLKPIVETSWAYAKVELIPPFSSGVVNGPLGRNFEKTCSKFGNDLLSGIQQKITDMDMDVVRKQKAKEDALKAAEKTAADAVKKVEEERKQKLAATKAKEEKAKDAKAKEEKPKEQTPKAEAKSKKPEPPKKK